MKSNTDQRLRAARKQGKQARERGESRESMPFAGDERFKRAWYEGFDDGD